MCASLQQNIDSLSIVSFNLFLFCSFLLPNKGNRITSLAYRYLFHIQHRKFHGDYSEGKHFADATHSLTFGKPPIPAVPPFAPFIAPDMFYFDSFIVSETPSADCTCLNY